MNHNHHPRWYRRLGGKLFLSYLAVVLVGAAVLVVAMAFSLPRAFERHLQAMELTMLGQQQEHAHEMAGMVGMEGMMGEGPLADDLLHNFRTAVTEATLLALSVASLIALALSAWMTQRIVQPVRHIMLTSRELTQGEYGRVTTPREQQHIDQLDELGQMAYSFDQMAQQLAEAEQLRRQLIGDVSHELNTPLTIIRGSMEGLLDGVLPPDPATFQEVQQEVRRLQRLVADLQELSRVEAGVVPLVSARLDFTAVVTRIIHQLRPQFNDKGVTLQHDAPPTPLWVQGDEDRLAQVVLNLVGNALQYTPAGGRVQVSYTAVETPTPHIQLQVADTGLGIPPEQLPHLFTRFYRVDKSRARASGGSGIGLTIARYHVHAHGGRIWAESGGEGQGSLFVVQLPISEEC